MGSTYAKEMGWYGGIYSHSKRANKSLNLYSNAAVLESLYYKTIGNFYYQKHPELYEKIALHTYDANNVYFLQSAPIELRHNAGQVMSKFSTSKQIARVEYLDRDFVVNVGVFKTQEEAQNYMKEYNISSSDFNITHGDVHSDDFLIATQYYKYDYHIPYKNELFTTKNIPFKQYMKAVKLQQKQAFSKKNSSKKPKNSSVKKRDLLKSKKKDLPKSKKKELSNLKKKELPNLKKKELPNSKKKDLTNSKKQKLPANKKK